MKQDWLYTDDIDLFKEQLNKYVKESAERFQQELKKELDRTTEKNIRELDRVLRAQALELFAEEDFDAFCEHYAFEKRQAQGE